jgi:hypothetical protein
MDSKFIMHSLQEFVGVVLPEGLFQSECVRIIGTGCHSKVLLSLLKIDEHGWHFLDESSGTADDAS